MINPYKIIFLCTGRTVNHVLKHLRWYQEMLNPRGIVIIANENVIKEAGNINKVEFVNEDALYTGLTFTAVKSQIYDLCGGHAPEADRTGWYFQQFLKMAYAFSCEEEQYLIWDSDTIPLHKVDMMLEEQYYFDIKKEYNKAYFDTMSILFPECSKQPFSFISEHMIIKKDIMIELIRKIENGGLSQVGEFWQKILCSISREAIGKSGFSEFETYGSYVMKYHPEIYMIRQWNSLRDGSIFFPVEKYKIEDLCKINSKYDAVSFENYKYQLVLGKIFAFRCFQNTRFLMFYETIKNMIKKMLIR